MPEGTEWHVTGTAHLVDVNNASWLRTAGGLGLALAAVALLAGLLFRSGVMVLICLVTNVLPLAMIGAIMVMLGLDLVTSGIIFTVAFGIAVDDTIHFLSKLRLQLAQGKSLAWAVKRSFLSTGKAIIVTSLILCGGFLTLTSSSFLGTFHIGLLISLTLLFAVLADLTFLPWLVCVGLSPRSDELRHESCLPQILPKSSVRRRRLGLVPWSLESMLQPKPPPPHVTRVLFLDKRK